MWRDVDWPYGLLSLQDIFYIAGRLLAAQIKISGGINHGRAVVLKGVDQAWVAVGARSSQNTAADILISIDPL